MRVCVDYRDLNMVTPKDVYPMPVANMLVDAEVRHELLSFIDGIAGKRGDHITDLRKVFKRMRLHKLKMNPAKCVFGVQGQNEFVWEPKHQEAFDAIKAHLASLLVLVPPRAGFLLKFYISAAEASIGSLLAQDNEEGVDIAQTDLVKYMLLRPILRGRIGKWVLALSEFPLQYVSQKVVKGQAIADFLAHHPMLDVPPVRDLEVATETLDCLDLACLPEYASLYQATVSLQPWVLYFDGSCTDTLAGAGVVLENPAGDHFSYSFQLKFWCTNNQVEYEALIIGLEVLLELGVRDIQVCGITLKYGVREQILKVERRTLPSWLARPDPSDDATVAVLDPIDVDWRIPLIAYIKQPDPTVDRKICFLALNYFLQGDELRRRGEDGIDFRCVYGHEAKRLMREAHAGVCGAHQAGPKMRWLIQRHGYFWPSILKDCIAFLKGCQNCQAHGPVQHVPNIPMQRIIKPCPARGWALDLIGMIHPHSSLQHKFIIVATDFFTKWVEAEPLKKASDATIRQFIFHNIVCRFGIPEVLVFDRGATFMGGTVEKLIDELGIQFIHSTPYYSQFNGQTEASNKIIITLLKKMLVANPCQWHEALYETLQAYRTSKRNPTATMPYALMFGHDAVLPLELNVQSFRV
ncbi:uncharacterized protein LOC112199236 [Rosa chinensis]|uniref:uncharacterized protein LOC112199236 n=1 Tax=Rosa chinensis TaxID=74649 RepID=UPI000D089643|nr:uncharacterized protein LOC112199236 [Rosa chinensis]